MRKAVISGVNGQSGSYLAEILLDKGYEVYGFSRRTANHSTGKIDHLMNVPEFKYSEGDVSDSIFINDLFEQVKPDEFYNLAAMSHVHTSFYQPKLTNDINYVGVVNILSGIKSLSPKTKMYQASTSELFGKSYSVDPDGTKYQDENTPFIPQSPYAISKLSAHHACRLYRESYGLFVSCGILGNHESPRRGENFLTRKVTLYLGRLKKWMSSRQNNFSFTSKDLVGLDGERFSKLHLGNLDSYRDWGYAKDYMEIAHSILQLEKPDDYVVGTGFARTVRDFVKVAFSLSGINNYEDFIVIDPDLYRPCEVDFLKMRPRKLKEKLGFEFTDSDFYRLVSEMVKHDEQI